MVEICPSQCLLFCDNTNTALSVTKTDSLPKDNMFKMVFSSFFKQLKYSLLSHLVKGCRNCYTYQSVYCLR